MHRFFRELFSAPFQLVLVVSFSLVAAVTIAVGALVTSRAIDDYLAQAMTDRITRDMQLAQSFYDSRLQELTEAADQLAHNPTVAEHVLAASDGIAASRQAVDAHVASQSRALMPSGSHGLIILDKQGRAVTGWQVTAVGMDPVRLNPSDWSGLPIVQAALRDRRPLAATEVLPVELLAQIGLDQLARIALVDTPKAAPTPFDPREGTAGLALVSVSPIVDAEGKTAGAALAFHLFNNDMLLVDQIKNIAGIDTVTVFFGDLRVATNVMTPDGKRAIGTRMSREVRQVVLEECCGYTGPAFVVDQSYITRYEPLRDHNNQVIGSLYVGVQQATFSGLVNTFNQRVALVTVATIVLTFLLAIPVSRTITRPLKELHELVGASLRVTQGDLTARAPVRTGGEVGLVARSFNTMLDTLQTTQDQLVHTEKLASLGQLAAGVAHELNNPLGTILLYSDILLRERPEYDPHYADMKMIVSETKRCKRIVGDLLNFARQQQVTAQPTNVHEMFRELIDLAPRRVKTVTVNFVTEFDPNLPIIEADTAQLRQVFVNLLTNAVEAMPQGGTLTIRTRAAPPGMITIELQDTGVGVSPENLSKLFTPFFTTKPIGKGTGLGLAIVYGIIKMHRGQINVQSQVEQGTTFTVTLPIKLPPVTSAPSVATTLKDAAPDGERYRGDSPLIG